jgi:hypothetical protein
VHQGPVRSPARAETDAIWGGEALARVGDVQMIFTSTERVEAYLVRPPHPTSAGAA